MPESDTQCAMSHFCELINRNTSVYTKIFVHLCFYKCKVFMIQEVDLQITKLKSTTSLDSLWQHLLMSVGLVSIVCPEGLQYYKNQTVLIIFTT